jgi:sterol desaturase/sphingolipid hydroxylase (fatty acid hydroxylase superfamily)
VNDYFLWRVAIFALTLGACAVLERLAPRRTRVAASWPRSWANLGLLAASFVVVRILVPFAPVETAYRVEGARWGLLNLASIWLPLKILLTLVVLDLAIYVQHRVFHAVPALWRLHAVHHSDLDLDASSGVRFHPLEIVLSTLWKCAIAAFFGLHFLGVALYEVLLSSSAIFNHANIHLGFLDHFARLFVVTPDLHRVHHSPSREETDSNFGGIVPWWDRLLGTYRPDPKEDHSSMTLGLSGARAPGDLGLGALLARPFKRSA